jgi:hypothetical protein
MGTSAGCSQLRNLLSIIWELERIVLALTIMVSSLHQLFFCRGIISFSYGLGLNLDKKRLSHLIANLAEHVANVDEGMRSVLPDHAITYNTYSVCRLLHHGLSQEISLYLNSKNSFLENGYRVQNHMISHPRHDPMILSWKQTQVVMNL